MKIKNILVTGASGKIGRNLILSLVQAGYRVRAVQFRTPLHFKKVEVFKGRVEDEAFIKKAAKNMDAICHLASCKEDREHFIEVSLRGTFNLLEACRNNPIQQFILAGGDASLGIYYYPHPRPLDEQAPLAAYPGYYAFSKAMEETMCRQYEIQYHVAVTILRFSWILEKDEFLRHLSVQEHCGVPHWRSLAKTPAQKSFLASGKPGVACLMHPSGKPYLRHVVDIHDVVQSFLLALGNRKALGQTFNIAAPKPFAYDQAAEYISKKLGWPVVKFTQGTYHDFCININKAKRVLGYNPQYDFRRMLDEAMEFRTKG